MRLVVLGSGTCIPDPNRLPSGYWLEAGGAYLRMDVGPGTVEATGGLGANWEHQTHQYVSHFHVDHIGDLAALLFSFKFGREQAEREPLTIFGPKGLKAFVDGLCKLYDLNLLDQSFEVIIEEVKPGDAFEISDDFVATFEKANHTKEALAIRLDADGYRIGYTGDTAWSDDLVTFFKRCDILIGECSFLEDTKGTPHLNAHEIGRLAQQAEVQHLVPTHFFFDPDHHRLIDWIREEYAGKISIARDGLTLQHLPRA